MGPLVGALAGPVASLLGGIGSSLFSSSSANKQLKMQVQENEKNRQFNAMQAALARQYNTEMIDKQNAYNDPSAVMARLLKAGIHPALAYTNGSGISNLGVGSTGMAASSSGSVGTSLPDFSGIRDAGVSMSQSMDLAEGAELKRVTAGLTEKQVEYFDKTKEKEFAVMDSTVLVNRGNYELSKMERAQVAKNIDVLDQTAKSIAQDILLKYKQNQIMSYEVYCKKIEAIYKLPSLSAQLESFRAAANLNRAQAIEVLSTLSYDIALLQAKTSEAYASSKNQNNQAVLTGQRVRSGEVWKNARWIDLQGDQIKFNIDNAWNFKAFDAAVDFMRRADKTLLNALGAKGRLSIFMQDLLNGSREARNN